MSDGSTVEDAINNIESNYVKSEEMEGYAKIEDIPSLEGYAKSDDIPSLDGYAKEEDIPSLYGYATQQWVNEQEFAHQEDLLEISFNDIQDSPISIDDSSELNLIDENGNVGFKVNNEGLFVKDVITSNHKLSDKADVIDIPTHTSQLINDSDFITKANVKSSIDEISSDIETIENIIEENEEIVSTALTDLNDRLSDVEENAVFSLNGIATEEHINEIKRNYTTKQESEDMEYVLTLAITQLETRVKELETKLTNMSTALDAIIES
jgi:hypothetical protein